MVKFIKDIIFGEPVVAVTIISLVLTAWLAALSQLDVAPPLWLAIAAPASIALGGFYTRANSQPDNAWVERHAIAPPSDATVTEPLTAETDFNAAGEVPPEVGTIDFGPDGPDGP